MTLDPDMSMAELVDIVERIAKLGEKEAHLELSLNGVVFRLYPSRVEADNEKDRLKVFVVFVRALLRMIRDGGHIDFVLRTYFDGTQALGIWMSSYEDGSTLVFLPCEVARVDLPVTPPSFSVPSFEEDEASAAPRRLRKILL